MNAKQYSSIDEIMKDWENELNNLKPIEINKNTLNDSLNTERNAIKVKYDKIINEYLDKNINK